MTSFFSREYFEEGVNRGEYLEYPTEMDGLKIFVKKDMPRCFVFKGRSKKPDSLLFKSNENMILAIDSIIKKTFDKQAEKMKQREADKKMAEVNRSKVQVGDLFSTSWGYDRTIVDFFQVVERVSDAYVLIRPIAAKTVSSNAMSADIAPIPDQFIGKAKKCQIDKRGNIVRADEFEHTAYPTDASKTHYTSWD